MAMTITLHWGDLYEFIFKFVCVHVCCVCVCVQLSDLYVHMHYFKREREQLSADLLPRRTMTCQLREVLLNIFILLFYRSKLGRHHDQFKDFHFT